MIDFQNRRAPDSGEEYASYPKEASGSLCHTEVASINGKACEIVVCL